MEEGWMRNGLEAIENAVEEVVGKWRQIEEEKETAFLMDVQ